MKLLIYSDLHLEFADFEPSKQHVDSVILAGDINLKSKAVDWAKRHFEGTPVIYVFGNHEFYGSAYPKEIASARERAAGSDVHILENESIEIDGVRFLGCTLWTDFCLHGDPRIAGFEAQSTMSDYRKIRRSPKFSKIRSMDTALIHRESLAWLQKTLSEDTHLDTVVVTHHAPSASSLPPAYKKELLSAAYASALDETIKASKANLWIHGHLHNSSNYMVGDTRVVCNPRGYPDEENDQFNSELILEI